MRLQVETSSAGGLALGRYRIIRRLAQGGMGVVYLGRLEGAAGFSKPVVIKRLSPDGEDDVEEATARFVREAQILSNLVHPGIVKVLDFGEEVGGHCMVLEYVNGYDLAKWQKWLRMRSRSMHWEHALLIMLRVLEALQFAHEFRSADGTPMEVLHRDVSPGNILLDTAGQVRLLDFGIARMAEGGAGQFKTRVGVLKGKTSYLAPELFMGSPPSASSDVYACGVVLYQMLAGRSPFAGENDSQVMRRMVGQDPTPLSRLRGELPPGLQASVMHALEKTREGRYAVAADFARDLRCSLIRPETVIAEEFRECVREDFLGEDLPAALELETLAERDRAWRSGSGIPIASATARGNLPHAVSARGAPPSSARAVSIREQVTARPPRRSRMPTPMVPAPRIHVDVDERTMTSVAPPRPPSDREPRVAPLVIAAAPRTRSSRAAQAIQSLKLSHVIGVGLGIGLVVVSGILGLLALLRPTPEVLPTQRFRVVNGRQTVVSPGARVPAKDQQRERDSSAEHEPSPERKPANEGRPLHQSK